MSIYSFETSYIFTLEGTKMKVNLRKYRYLWQLYHIFQNGIVKEMSIYLSKVIINSENKMPSDLKIVFFHKT